MLMMITRTTRSTQGSTAFQSGMRAGSLSISSPLFVSPGVFWIFLTLTILYMNRRTIVTSPEKTPTSPIADPGRMFTNRIADSPSESPASTAGAQPLLIPSMPSATQSIPSESPVEITGRKSATWLPMTTASNPNTAAGRVIGTARRENEVSGSYPRHGSATEARGENPSAIMMGGSIVTGVAPIETRKDPNPTFRIMICSYRSAAIDLICSEMLLIAPDRSIIVTWRMVKRTIRDIPNDARIPAYEAYNAISGEVLKKKIATSRVRIHPATDIRMPDCFRNTIPVNMTRMGKIARKNRNIVYNGMPASIFI